MNNSFARIIEGMTTTLRQEVLTRLHDDYARGQVYGVINLLNNLTLRADWSVRFLRQEVQATLEALQQARALSETYGVRDFPAPFAFDAGLDTEGLLKQREQANEQLIEGLRCLWANQTALSQPQCEAIETLLRTAMRREVEVELKHLAKPMFAEMSQGSE
jgi:hypothetical protein